MPLAIILNNQSIGKNCPEISAVRSGNVEQNVIGEAWVIKPENLTSVWRPECDVWEVAIQGDGTYAGSHKVKYLRQASDIELNQLGVYTSGVTGADYSGTKVVKDTGYVVGATPAVNITAENATIRCDKGSSGVITAYKSKIQMDEGTNVVLHATDCTITAAGGTVLAEKSKVIATNNTIVNAVDCTVEAHDSVSIKSKSSRLTISGRVNATPSECTVNAKDDCVVSCYDEKVKVTASDHVVCIVNNIEEAHATGSISDSFAKQRFILSDSAVIVSRELGDYVWTSKGKYYPAAVKEVKLAPTEVKRGRPRKDDTDEVAVG